jgi:hypothetical protein
MAENAGVLETGTGPLKPTVAVSWPEDEFPQNPHQFFAISGWHSFRGRGDWDVDALAQEVGDRIQFSECEGADDLCEAVEDRWQGFTFSPREGVIVMVRVLTRTICSICVWAPSHERAKREFMLLRERYKLKRKRAPGKTNFVVITNHRGTLGTRAVEMNSALRRDADLILHYGQEFTDWSSKFLTQLKQKQTGVAILRGEPGTGKTTYLRYLTHKLRRTHRFYYLPLCTYPVLAAPAAVNFWLEQNERYNKFKKVVILEDAESLLMQRGADNQESLSNLLNISDGFLGEMLKMHVVCTINCPLDKIDSAILRPGRLVGMRQFLRLSPAQATLLARTKSLAIDPQDNYSLAELYNDGREANSVKRILGFAVRN